MRKTIVGLTLAALLVLATAGAARAEFAYQKQFDTLLDYLMENHWDESGDWSGDMMGDASWFGPALLFQMGADEGHPELTEMAVKTVDWELALFKEGRDKLGSIKITDDAVSMIGGLPGLFYGFKHTGRKDLKTFVSQTLVLGCTLAKSDPQNFVDGFGGDMVVFLAGISFANYLYHVETGTATSKNCALDTVALLDEKYWNAAEKHYGELWDWSAAASILGLSGVYRLTGDERYRARADEVLETTRVKLWDEENGGLLSKHFTLKKAKVLSGNNFFTMALTEWYRATGDEKYLDYATRTLDFIFSPDLWDGTYPHHHWTAEEGRDPSFCTGCHFHTLFNLYELKKALEEEKYQIDSNQAP